jgi:hypothetical protein
MNVKFPIRWNSQHKMRSALDCILMVWPPSSLECVSMFEDPGKYKQTAYYRLAAVTLKNMQTACYNLAQLAEIICYRMLSYHSCLTSFIIRCWAITAVWQDNLLSDVELSQLSDKIICYPMLSYHSCLTRSFVIGCWAITAVWQDHFLSDAELLWLADKIIYYLLDVELS